MDMKKYCLFALAAGCMLLAGCSGGSGSNEVPVIDMASGVEMSDAPELVYTDIEYVPLDTATAALLGEYSNIMAVMGDTIIMHDMDWMGGDSRLLLFSLADGRFIREIKHIGQGPGEYSWIESIFPDRGKGDIVIKGANNAIGRYTLSDSLVSSKTIASLANNKFAVGSLVNGVNVAEPIEGNLLIHQYDAEFNVVNTLFVPDYEPRFISMAINTSGDKGMMNVVDTVYNLLPGRMDPVVILSRGDKALTPKVEQDVYLNQKDYNLGQEMRKRYIEFAHFDTVGDQFIVCYYYGGNNYCDIYSLTDGKLLGRCKFTWQDGGFELPWGDTTFQLRTIPFYAGDGRFYMKVDDEQAIDADGNQNPDANIGIISFRFAQH